MVGEHLDGMLVHLLPLRGDDRHLAQRRRDVVVVEVVDLSALLDLDLLAGGLGGDAPQRHRTAQDEKGDLWSHARDPLPPCRTSLKVSGMA